MTPFPDPSGTPVASLLDLTGKVVAVTGGARGIGAAVVRRLEEAGATVASLDLAGDPPVDVTDSAQVEDALGSLVERTGRLDALVNNVGVFPSAPIEEMTDELWDHVVATTLTSAFRCSRAAVRLSPGLGAIVSVGSVESQRGLPRLAHYVAAKHGLVGLTRALAVELGPRGVRVLGVEPGLVDTESTRPFPRVADPDARAAFETSLPAGRMATPDDVARVVLFALSDLAAFVTGVVIPVDGGELAGEVRLPGAALA
jgi:NAD(P)-dependent dehydrogenase (short-subunit alcohol dehydrogenase family)